MILWGGFFFLVKKWLKNARQSNVCVMLSGPKLNVNGYY